MNAFDLPTRRRVAALACGVLVLAGCSDLDRQMLELGSMTMLILIVVEALVMLASLTVPSTSGFRTLGLVLGGLVAVPGLLVAFFCGLIYAGRKHWEFNSSGNLVFVLYGAAALVWMTVRIGVWNTPDEQLRLAEAGLATQSKAPRNAAIGCVLVATAILVALFVRTR
ncbi:MAG: hypothetical protein HOV80_09505 [Polyangiaceae bacterium]|nr:hypothetical protein [Polyangiaceae bacterium]